MNFSTLRKAGTILGMTAVLGMSGVFFATPSFAAQADLDLIQAHVGDWRGSGSMKRSGQPTESVRCRMDVTKSSNEKVNINGACSLAGGRLNMYGTLAYINGSYQAVINTAAFDQITATGRRNGSSVNFNFQAADDGGENTRISSGFKLSGDTINVSFTITNADGSKINATVPLGRQ